VGTLIAAGVVSFIGVYWAQKFHAHPKVFTVAAVIPMIPGKLAFTAVLALFELNHEGATVVLLTSFVGAFMKMFFITAALAPVSPCRPALLPTPPRGLSICPAGSDNPYTLVTGLPIG